MTMNLPAVNPSELGKQLAVARSRVASDVEEGFQFLKMGKDGIWIYGADDTEVEEDSLWAVNPYSFAEGFIAWNDSEVVGEEMAPMVGAPPIRLSELPQVPGNGWQKQVAVQMACVSGADKGTQVLFKTSSKGGRKALSALIAAVTEQISEDPEKIVPMIELTNSSYKHKKYGKIFTPEMPVKKWVSMTTDAFSITEDKPPAKAKGKAVDIEDEDDDEDAAPEPQVRTRRRRLAE
jgi:hypothetical protein